MGASFKNGVRGGHGLRFWSLSLGVKFWMDGTFWKVHLSIWDRCKSAVSFGGRIISFIGYVADIRCTTFFDQTEIIQTIILPFFHPNINNYQTLQIIPVACLKVDLLRPTTHETVLRDAQSFFSRHLRHLHLCHESRHHSASELEDILVFYASYIHLTRGMNKLPIVLQD